MGPGRGRLFRDFFETFGLLAPRLPLPGPQNLNFKAIFNLKGYFFINSVPTRGIVKTSGFTRVFVKSGDFQRKLKGNS